MDVEDKGHRMRWGFDTSRPTESFTEVARGVLVEPARFFAGLRESREDEEGLGSPLLFAGACLAIGLFLTLLATPLDPLGPDAMSDPLYSFFLHPQGSLYVGSVAVIYLLVVIPIGTVLSVYLVAIVVHLFVFVFVRERRSFRATFLVVAYGSAILLVDWIPVLGYLVSLYGIYVVAVGIRELHDTTTTRALLAVLVPYLLPYAWSVYTLWSLSTPF